MLVKHVLARKYWKKRNCLSLFESNLTDPQHLVKVGQVLSDC